MNKRVARKVLKDESKHTAHQIAKAKHRMSKEKAER